jgi:hypothetical protein
MKLSSKGDLKGIYMNTFVKKAALCSLLLGIGMPMQITPASSSSKKLCPLIIEHFWPFIVFMGLKELVKRKPALAPLMPITGGIAASRALWISLSLAHQALISSNDTTGSMVMGSLGLGAAAMSTWGLYFFYQWYKHILARQKNPTSNEQSTDQPTSTPQLAAMPAQ